MKITRCLFALALLAPLLAPGQTPAERKRAADYLAATRDSVLAQTGGLTEAQLAFKPAPDKWSVTEVLEHIAATEDFMFGLVEKQVMQAPPRPPGGEDAKAIDEFVLKTIPDRTAKAQAPEPLVPVRRFGSAEGSRNHFAASRAKTIAFLRETKGLRDHAIDSPLGKKLDAYQWLLFIGAHSERHGKQIAEVMADAKFPAH